MKKVLLASASVAALFIAAPAMAGPGDNQSTVSQSGDNQNATVNQTGANDVSTIDQQNANNTATVNQAGTTGGTSSISQTGSGNTATVQTQQDDGSLYPGGQSAEGGSYPPGAFPISLSTITQGGNNNDATVIQKTAITGSRSSTQRDRMSTRRQSTDTSNRNAAYPE